MAYKWSKDAVIECDDSGGTVRDLSQYCDGTDMEKAFDELDTTGFGDSSQEVIAGLQKGSFSIKFKWDDTATTGPDAVLAGAAGLVGTVSFYPAGTPAGATKPKYSAEALLKSFKITGQIGSLTMGQADYVVSGGITRAVA
jgi:hypothetical protein